MWASKVWAYLYQIVFRFVFPCFAIRVKKSIQIWIRSGGYNTTEYWRHHKQAQSYFKIHFESNWLDIKTTNRRKLWSKKQNVQVFYEEIHFKRIWFVFIRFSPFWKMCVWGFPVFTIGRVSDKLRSSWEITSNNKLKNPKNFLW